MPAEWDDRELPTRTRVAFAVIATIEHFRTPLERVADAFGHQGLDQDRSPGRRRRMDQERVHPAIRRPPPIPPPPLIDLWRSTITYCCSQRVRAEPSQARAGEPGGGGPGVVGHRRAAGRSTCRSGSGSTERFGSED
jgi:hypothetical protein